MFKQTFCTMWLVLIASLPLLAPVVSGQEIVVEEAPLIDQEPFDLITLTAEAGGASVKVLPIDFPGRKVPANPAPTQKIEVTLVKYQERRYSIAWKAIEKIELYEQRIYDQASQSMQSKDFALAFQNLSFLMRNFAEMPNLEQLRKDFIFESAKDRYLNGELRQTLSALEELRATAPGYQSGAVLTAMSNVASSLVEDYQKRGELGTAKLLLGRLRSQYGPTLKVIEQWEDRLEKMALEKKDEAVSLIQQQRFREARKAAIEMIGIFPDLDEGKALIEEINKRHPMVRVGVMQRSGKLDPGSLVDWPARRAGALAYRSLFQFLETGSEGGRYGFALGTFRLSDDRQQLVLSLDPSLSDAFNAFGLAQELLSRAEPTSPNYDPSWAAISKAVSVPSANQIIVQLQRPNVLPHALLQWMLPGEDGELSSLPGEYRLEAQDEPEAFFVLRDEAASSGQPVEIVEVFYSNPKEAVNDLLRGEIDVLDQLYPADAKRLEGNLQLVVGRYALPTTHMLIPVSDNPYLADSKFRRALLYSTDRSAILTGELLGSTNTDDGRLISGPFPIGEGENDPLAYAYNPDIAPAVYNAYLARLLLVMTQRELNESAQKKNQPMPELDKLLVGCPDFEFARVAVQAMIQQWMNIGVKAEMVVLEPGVDVRGCDLVYVVANMWEPATDIERLLGGNGLATSDNPFIVQSLDQLRKARNWREVRTELQKLHQLIDYHLPVIPLWQVTDRFAVRNYVEGLEDRPVSLYQNVDNWRVNLGLRAASR